MRGRGGGRRPASSIIEEAPERPGSARMLELTQCLGLDLADALARQRELLADLLQRVAVCTQNSDSHVVGMQSTEEWLGCDASDPLHRGREWRVFVQRSVGSQIRV